MIHHTREWLIEQADKAEKFLNKYETIVARDFSEPGDYHGAMHALSDLARVYAEVGDPDSLKMAKKIRMLHNKIKRQFETAAKEVRKERKARGLFGLF